MATTPIPMISPDYSSVKLVPPEQVEDAKAQQWEPAAKMVGPDGAKKVVPASQVFQARQSQFAVTADSPGAQKMVSPGGQVNYVLPDEVQQFKSAGHTLIAPDGSFNLQNIRGEDPLAEQQRYQRVRKALTPQEQSGATKAEAIDAAKSGVSAALATAGGVSGAGTLGALTDPTAIASTVGTGITDAAGNEITKDIIQSGPSLLRQGATKVAELALKHKITTGAVGYAVLKQMGLNPMDIIREVLTK